jgi:hypothetical protein
MTEVKANIRRPLAMDRLLSGVEKAFQPATPAPEQRATIHCRCGHCGVRIKAPLSMLNETRACPGCCQTLVVRPQAPADEEGPVLIEAAPAAPRRAW